MVVRVDARSEIALVYRGRAVDDAGDGVGDHPVSKPEGAVLTGVRQEAKVGVSGDDAYGGNADTLVCGSAGSSR